MRRIMHGEQKGGELAGPGRNGWVELTRSKRGYRYRGRELKKIRGGYKYNCVDVENGETYWVSGPTRDGQDRLYGGLVEIDDDAREEYWVEIRRAASNRDQTSFRS
jgi:hypothetical protein